MAHPSTILIVDDDQVTRTTLEYLLGEHQYRVVTAQNGREGFSRALEVLPDVILLDVVMPEMDGFEVCRRIRATPDLAEVPILMITTLGDRDSRLRGIEVGADDFLPKPFDRVELTARVQTITRLNRYRRLLTERKRFEWAVEQSDEGYLVIDTEEYIRYANPAARRYLGLPPDGRLFTSTFRTLASRQYRLEPSESWAHWLAEQTWSGFLVRPESTTAREAWLQIDRLPMPVETGSDVLIRLRDVTEQLALQRDIWKFHHTIVHKLRTPLVGIMGGLQTLVSRGTSLAPNDIVKLANMSLEGAQRLHNDIEEVIQYISTPNLAYPGNGASLSQIAVLLAELQERLNLPSVQVDLDSTLGTHQVVLSRRALELVLIELLENARKFHPIQDPQIEIELNRTGTAMIRLSIKDNGVTLSAEQIDQAWLPYYQGEKYLTGQANGMGLGLPMVATVICGIGGSVRLYNREDGPGVTVELLIPEVSF